MIKKKISELPECTSFKGLWTIGVDIFNKSVKVSLEYIQSVVEGMKSATKKCDRCHQRGKLRSADGR